MPAYGQRALEHLARRGRCWYSPTGLVSVHAAVARVRERAVAPVVGLLRHLARGDADVVGDPALADHRVVAARRRAGVGHVVEQDAVDVGPVVEAEVHRVVERPGAPRELRHAVLDDLQAGGEPAVVDRGQDRDQRRAGRRPGRQLRARAVVVPVVELAGRRVALHPLERRERLREPPTSSRLADEAELLGRDRAPHVRADVRRRRLHARRAVGVEDVGRQAGALVGHRDEGRPGALRVLAQLTAAVAPIRLCRRCAHQQCGKRCTEVRHIASPNARTPLRRAGTPWFALANLWGVARRGRLAASGLEEEHHVSQGRVSGSRRRGGGGRSDRCGRGDGDVTLG